MKAEGDQQLINSLVAAIYRAQNALDRQSDETDRQSSYDEARKRKNSSGGHAELES